MNALGATRLLRHAETSLSGTAALRFLLLHGGRQSAQGERRRTSGGSRRSPLTGWRLVVEGKDEGTSRVAAIHHDLHLGEVFFPAQLSGLLDRFQVQRRFLAPGPMFVASIVKPESSMAQEHSHNDKRHTHSNDMQPARRGQRDPGASPPDTKMARPTGARRIFVFVLLWPTTLAVTRVVSERDSTRPAAKRNKKMKEKCGRCPARATGATPKPTKRLKPFPLKRNNEDMLRTCSGLLASAAPRAKFPFNANALLAGLGCAAAAVSTVMIWQYYVDWRRERRFRRFWESKKLPPESWVATHANPHRLTAIQMDLRSGRQRQGQPATNPAPAPAARPGTTGPERVPGQ